MLLWDETYATGFPDIDEQHRRLFDQINQLGALLSSINLTREELEFMMNLVTFLEAYAGNHFKYEEDCMVCYGCPASAENKAAHSHFRKTLADFQLHYRREGTTRALFQQLHLGMSRWIQAHILKVDLQLKACLNV